MGETIDEPRLITAALPYVNNVPHIGHLVGSHLPADIFARYCRLKGYKVLFIGGTDEHGTPTEIAALEFGTTPEGITDFFYGIHKNIYKWFRISYDNFSRTSKSKVHYIVTKEIFLTIFKNGYIVEREQELPWDPKAKRFLQDRYVVGTCPYCGYEKARGDQCEKCGKLLDPKDLVNPRSVLTGESVEFRKTRHLFLDLSKLENKLREWIESRKRVWRDTVYSLALSWIKEGLKPRSITRDLKWGVPVPYKELWELVKERIKDKLNKESKERFIDSIINELRKLNLVVPNDEIEKIKKIVDRFWPDVDKILNKYNYFEIYKNKVLYVWFDAPIGYLSFTIEKTSTYIQLKDLENVRAEGYNVVEANINEVIKMLEENRLYINNEYLRIEGDKIFKILRDDKEIGFISFFEKKNYLELDCYYVLEKYLANSVGKERILDKALKLVLEKTGKDYIKLPMEKWVEKYYNRPVDISWKEFWINPKAKIYHFLGKDNIPFHTIFWPGILLAFNDRAIGFVKVLKDKPEVGEIANVKIEEIDDRDLEKIYKLSKYFAKEVPGAIEDTPEFIKECGIKLKAIVDKEIVGYILGKVYPDGFLVIESLYVLPEHRRKGIGIALVRALEKLAFEKGYKRIYVPAATVQSYNLFKKLGYEFAKEGIVTNYWLNLPYNVVGLQYLNYEGRKISKSQKWGVFCENIPKAGLNPDYWRFYLSFLIPERKDTEFRWEEFKDIINKELVGNIANFVYRILSFVQNKYGGDLSGIKPDTSILDVIKNYKKDIEKLFENVELTLALRKILEFSDLGNKIFQEHEPWKNPESKKSVMKALLYYVRALGIFLHPFIPAVSEKILKLINYPTPESPKWEDIDNFDELQFPLPKPVHIARRISVEELEKIRSIVTKLTDFSRVFKEEKRHTSMISIEDFKKLDLRIGKIIEVKDHPNADKLYVLKVDLGNEVRTLVAGLKKYYKPEELLGRLVVVLANLEPKEIRGIKSEGMLLAADSGSEVALLEPDKNIKPGAKIR